jgi:hypothetical protein
VCIFVKPIGKELNVIYLRHASGYTKSLVVVKKTLQAQFQTTNCSIPDASGVEMNDQQPPCFIKKTNNLHRNFEGCMYREASSEL